VWLELTTKNFYIERVETETHFDHEFRDADLKLRVFVGRNEKGEFLGVSAPFEVRGILSTRDGKEIQRESFTGTITGAHNGRDIPLTMHVHEPAQWNAETPNLYDLRVELILDGKTIHSWQDRVGFREISTANGVLRINGKVVKLRGVCRHDEHPDVGRATRPQDWMQD